LFLSLAPFLWGRVSVLSDPLGVMQVHCLFFNFAEQFDFGCYLLAQEMNFVTCYLPCFREWLIICLLLAFLPFQYLFTNSPWGDQFLAHLPFSGALSAILLLPLCCLLVYSSLFIA
jgi:hypothetical protein